MEADPFYQFEKWFLVAKNEEKSVEPNMMSVSTIGLDGYPNSRYVLLKEVKDGHFIFFTNYGSTKGQEIQANNKVCLSFYWPSKFWAVRIQGEAFKISPEENSDYFLSRPLLSQAASICSKQSSVLSDSKDEFVRASYPGERSSRIT